MNVTKYSTNLVVFLFMAITFTIPAFARDREPTRPVRQNQNGAPQPPPRGGDARVTPPDGHPRPAPGQDQTANFPDEYRTVDGSGNNKIEIGWGATDSVLLRMSGNDYADGTDAPSGLNRPSARAVSNACASQTESVTDEDKRITDYFWQWGQFVDHDITLVPILDPSEPFDVEVPEGDPYFDPESTGSATIPLDRSFYFVVDGVREQANEITAYIDASNVYGSDDERALALRTLDSTGRLKTSEGNLLPFNEEGQPNAPSDSAEYFLAGDFRANEQVGLTALHTLFMREHNYWVNQIQADNPMLSWDELYEAARAMVVAEIQAITYKSFLPILLGPQALSPYEGYKSDTNAGIANEFATAAYRLGHSMISTVLKRIGPDGETVPEGDIALRDAFFNPEAITELGIEPYLRGLAAQKIQKIDNFIVDDLRNFLFGPPGSGGFDLASLNIQRGRDHGIPSYNQMRVALGLAPAESFSDITSNAEIRANLASVYTSPDDVDLWVGGLSEDHVPGALVGETFFAILKDQFERLRDGDRFWYEGYLSPEMVRMVNDQTLARIIRRNTTIGNELQDDVFHLPYEGLFSSTLMR